jgi:AcrR family transcriptional regulator
MLPVRDHEEGDPTMAEPERDDDGRAPDRRARRRAETMSEILDRALTIMAEEGVAGLTMTRLARAMRIQPPSLYKYFPSVNAVHDALFRRGQEENLATLRAAMASAEPGLPALRAGLRALGGWAVANPVLAQLLFWRPVPGFRPSAEAFAPADEVVALLHEALRHGEDSGQLGPGAASERGLALLSALHFGVISQHLANEPDADWDHGTFTSLHPTVLDLFERAYPGLRPAAGVGP